MIGVTNPAAPGCVEVVLLAPAIVVLLAVLASSAIAAVLWPVAVCWAEAAEGREPPRRGGFATGEDGDPSPLLPPASILAAAAPPMLLW